MSCEFHYSECPYELYDYAEFRSAEYCSDECCHSVSCNMNVIILSILSVLMADCRVLSLC